ncbi:RNA pseudouridylate synthase domain-containing protein 2 [Capsaspora owczarzaki ATCC 30864]|uniref:RNA pseudouridylate synthase domain-containing protein 2 n=1 Tax=Capsaspora owczarzaki (strain ATCC 30864) TaxID=595528 RepID=A0A0D2WPH8_CAPO3|nr:RNA pseudouridylate synthase domain-containing protein 2 [Capsaspora owczarzaki ATCC 30864]KJE92563.1 RNA pseudouridylate synthase domain-containing protein 2 [Capsaspora owczarzaki ATCC 30864]|eukprot:XP_004348412.1 RNA pseudouridylate synthase domain-containing protein 2 [Capsaspora owczarzaki ATCC 30864]
MERAKRPAEGEPATESTAALTSASTDSNSLIHSGSSSGLSSNGVAKRPRLDPAQQQEQQPRGAQHGRRHPYPPQSRPQHGKQTHPRHVASGAVGNIESYTRDGLRFVKPYLFRFVAYAKRRWIGLGLLELFRREFRVETPAYFDQAIRDGRVTVNGKVVAPSYIIQDSDVLVHTAHRHEPPVTAAPIRVIAETDDLVVIDKPASIPVHVAGRFNVHTVISIMKSEMGYSNLLGCHRLDRLTSGVLVMAKNRAAAAAVTRLITEREVEKFYICRVTGVFPQEQVTCTEPLLSFCPKFGLNGVDPSGKPAETVFVREQTNGVISIVKCFPKTGRAHQIRVHLQYLGYPIENDPIYNSPAFGPSRGKGGVQVDDRDRIVAAFTALLNPEDAVRTGASGESTATTATSSLSDPAPQTESPVPDDRDTAAVADDDDGDGGHDRVDLDDTLVGPTAESAALTISTPAAERMPYCLECLRTRTLPSPNACLYLHAWRYKSADWDFATELPEWSRLSDALPEQ